MNRKYRLKAGLIMTNNIWGKGIYSNIINSYMKAPSSPKIKGTLLAIDENKVKLDVGNGKAMDLVLNKFLNAKVGDTVTIKKSDIVNAKMGSINTTTEEPSAEITQGKYEYILSSLGMPAKEGNIEAAKILDHHGVNVTKENIVSFLAAKEQLSSLSEKLDYDKVIQLKDKDIDFEKESLQKVLQELEGVKVEKKPFSLLRFLGLKKDMTTEEAEKIAHDLYGSKMGKDVTDIIKALDKAGVKITRESIDHVDRLFHKLHNIQGIEDTTIIDSVKNKIEPSIDALYKLKNAITKGAIRLEEKLGEMVSKAYNAYGSAGNMVTEEDLKRLEGDIEARLMEMGVKVTEEIISTAKDVVARGLDLTKENLERIVAIKGSILELNTNLDYEKTAILMAGGIDMEKIHVVHLANMVADIADSQTMDISLGLDKLGILQLIEKLDMMTIALHHKLGLENTLEGLNITQGMMDGEISLEQWLSQLQGLEDSKETAGNIKMEDVTRILENRSAENAIEAEAKAAIYLRANAERLGSLMEEGYSKELIHALIQVDKPLNLSNVQALLMEKRMLDRVAENLTNEKIESILDGGNKVEKLSLNQLERLLTSSSKANEQPSEEKTVQDALKNAAAIEEAVDKAKGLVDTLKQITPERRDSIISLLMKNAMPLTLKEVQKLSFFLNNERQIGHELEAILSIIENNKNEEIAQLAARLRTGIHKMTSDMKEGKPFGERPYEEFSQILRALESKSAHLSGGERSSLQKSGERLLDSLELQVHLNRQDTLLQLPLMMGDQLKNLQMYVMRDKKGSKKIDPKNMSVLLNFDTNNMGNINIYMAVNYSNIVMKIGLNHTEDKELIENYTKDLEKYLEDLGYSLKDLSFRIDEDTHILSMHREIEGNHQSLKKLLDIKI
ncbi:DUF6240 domain-containing protein [Alkaliphilus oremlandii]|nr:DUF6240 domain-containing protein [Alkaliphilus oremlandii]